ncbi:glycosyltransferase [bacterium]|nr:glycosyltransferase [bacterium]
MKKVYIVILNWNGLKDTLECLKSLEKLDYSLFKVVIVDNGSEDKQEVCLITQKYPWVELIVNKENLGFAGGNNVGIKYALNCGADYILLLNNDTIVESSLLKELVKVIESNKKIGMAGPKIYYQNPLDKVWFGGGKIRWWRPVHIGEGVVDRGKLEKVKQSDYISGCALLIKKEVIEKIGLLDNRFFLYYEDVDWSLRARKAGYRLMFVPQARVWHKISSSLGKSSVQSIYYGIRNRLLLLQKHAHRFEHWVFLVFVFPFVIIKNFIYLMVKKKNWNCIFQAVYDYHCRRFGKRVFRIAIDMRWIAVDTGGIRQYILNLVTNLSKVDIHNEYLLLVNNTNLKKEIKEKCKLNTGKNFSFHLIPYSSTSWKNYIWLPVFLWWKKISVLHLPFFTIPFLSFGHKTIINVYDLIPYLYPHLCPGKKTTKYYSFYRFIVALILKRADKIIACSKATFRDIIQAFPGFSKKTAMVYVGVGNEFYPRKEYNLSFSLPVKKRILYVGRQDPSKNITGLIYAFANLRKNKQMDCCLVIVGKKDPRYPDIYSLVKELNIEKEVIFTGYVSSSELPLFYNASDLFVFPSFYEGFGIPPLEAMACGVPVVSSKAASLPEVVGKAGIIVDPNDVDALTEAMYEVLSNNDLREKMIKQGLKQAKVFSWEKAAYQTRKIYEEVG